MAVLYFLYIFDFVIIKGIGATTSSIVVCLYLILSAMMAPDYKQLISKFLLSEQNQFIVKNGVMLIVVSIFYTCLHSQYDFSYTKVLVHQFINLEIGVLLIAYSKYKKTQVVDSVVKSFVIQAAIQLLCFLSPTFLRVTDIFRDDATIMKREESYAGFRGLAISSSAFFGLAIAYVVVLVLFAIYWDRISMKQTFKVLSVPLLVFGSLSAGRTAVLGVTFLIVWLLIKAYRKLLSGVSKRSFIIGCLFFSLILLSPLYANKLQLSSSGENRFIEYLTQFVSDDGTIDVNNVSSLNHLKDSMYFSLKTSQILLGDGRYTEVSGRYYMNTDAGYMRNLLYWGIIGTILLYRYYWKLLTLSRKKGDPYVLFVLLFLLSAILEIKGQVMGFLIISQSLLLLIAFGRDAIHEESIGNDTLQIKNHRATFN